MYNFNVTILAFKADEKNAYITMNKGLWKYSRHPNYLGEILFWFGLFGFSLSQSFDNFWLIICPLSMLAMFIFASIPMMDNRSLERRPDYEEYTKALRYMEKVDNKILEGLDEKEAYITDGNGNPVKLGSE